MWTSHLAHLLVDVSKFHQCTCQDLCQDIGCARTDFWSLCRVERGGRGGVHCGLCGHCGQVGATTHVLILDE